MIEFEHKLTVIGEQTKLRHPKTCVREVCMVEAAVAKSTLARPTGLYRAFATPSGKLHTVAVYIQRELVS